MHLRKRPYQEEKNTFSAHNFFFFSFRDVFYWLRGKEIVITYVRSLLSPVQLSSAPKHVLTHLRLVSVDSGGLCRPHVRFFNWIEQRICAARRFTIAEDRLETITKALLIIAMMEEFIIEENRNIKNAILLQFKDFLLFRHFEICFQSSS